MGKKWIASATGELLLTNANLLLPHFPLEYIVTFKTPEIKFLTRNTIREIMKLLAMLIHLHSRSVWMRPKLMGTIPKPTAHTHTHTPILNIRIQHGKQIFFLVPGFNTSIGDTAMIKFNLTVIAIRFGMHSSREWVWSAHFLVKQWMEMSELRGQFNWYRDVEKYCLFYHTAFQSTASQSPIKLHACWTCAHRTWPTSHTHSLTRSLTRTLFNGKERRASDKSDLQYIVTSNAIGVRSESF